MTKISLRVYNREIEAMVESGQVEEAIAHCQFILKSFPMHLETYRLLGKAFLETRRYADAADIFQRVLMSVPEDFVSHVGMSIIRDDENKLDEAIWHMERAFEVQPSNPAIQDELRKLYGRRDGVQPPKVRLTRDALANMYTQGALYSQAIAEIRAVLADDPIRPDLQVMLARAYSKDGRKKQAIEICTELLKKYPYCFDALRILIDLLSPTDEHEFTQTYRLRVSALDPYAGFVTGSIFNSDNVPDAAVNLEFLDYNPNDLESGLQPAWASSLGIRLESENDQQEVPDWLSEQTNENQSNSEEVIPQPALEGETKVSSEVEDVPDWMRSSGWEQPADQTIENDVFDENEFEDAEPLATADIPEWLKKMAPEKEVTVPDKLPDGFESVLEGTAINFPLDDNLFVTKQEPDKLEDILENDKYEEENLNWENATLNDKPIQGETQSTAVSQSAEPDQIFFNKLPSDLPQENQGKAPDQPVDDISSWLEDVQHEVKEDGNASNGSGNNEVDLPDWLKDIGSEEQIGDFGIPNELKAEIENQPEGFSSTGNQIDSDLETRIKDELPDWLKEIDSNQDAISINNEFTSSLGAGSEIPSPEEDEKDSPDLQMINEPEELGFIKEIQTQISEDTQKEIGSGADGLPSMDDQDAAMAWLEGLAARQGAKSEELLTSPEVRMEEPPEWVKNSIEDEKIFSVSPEHELFDKGIKEQYESKLDEDSDATKFTGEAEQSPVSEAIGMEKLVEGKVITSPDLGSFPEESFHVEPEELTQLDPTVSGVLPFDGKDESSTEEGKQEGHTLGQDLAATVSDPEIVISPISNDSNWLKELDGGDGEIIPGEPISPKISEFYGSDINKSLPDWLKEMEKGSSSSEWISESEGSHESNGGSNLSDMLHEEKDIDDIGEIFPTDTSNWTFKESGSEPGLEPLNEAVKPVTAGEWQPVQPDLKTTSAEVITDPSKIGSSHPRNELPQVSKLSGTGMLTKIPAKDIEKEAGNLERAQSFIESGEIEKAIEVYGRLIKKGQLLEGVIHDLRETTYRYPVEIGIWQLLGDAYMRSNRLQDALDAYTKAEELLR